MLGATGHKPEGEALARWIALLERVDELHRHAEDVETIAGICSALTPFAEGDSALPDATNAHGSAFRETALLRNRAYRWVEAAVAAHARERRVVKPTQ